MTSDAGSNQSRIRQDNAIQTQKWQALAIQIGEQLDLEDPLKEQYQNTITGSKTCLGKPLINLCQDKNRFISVLIAALLSRRTMLLPANTATGTQRALVERYQGMILHDGNWQENDANTIDISKLDFCRSDLVHADAIKISQSIDTIPDDFPAVIVHTSGSTGEPTPIHKNWQTLKQSTMGNAQEMFGKQIPDHIIATVPSQHMWGFETSALLPFFKDINVHPAQPFFPQDIADAIAETIESDPTKRVCLISTPVHLRALIQSGISLQPIDQVLCATSPLDKDLAYAIEEKLNCSLTEIYGCSEAGSLAKREPTEESNWKLFDHLVLHQEGEKAKAQKKFYISSNYFTKPIPLADNLLLSNVNNLASTAEVRDSSSAISKPTYFALAGRQDDLLEIGGKKQYLSGITAILQTHPKVRDAYCFKMPSQQDTRPRIALIVEATEIGNKEIKRYLADKIDSLFIPKIIKVVDKLPRETNGKLTKQRLLSLVEK